MSRSLLRRGQVGEGSSRRSPDRILSPEARRVLATVGDVDRSRRPALESEVADGEALVGERLLALALQERAVSVVWNDLSAEERSELPSDLVESFRALSGIEEFRAREMSARLEDVLSVMSDVGASAVLLKGAGLAHDTDGYVDPRQRPMFDLDVLVEEERAAEVRAHLLRTGWSWDEESLPDAMYREHCHLPPLQHEAGPGTVLELHTDLFPGGDPFAMGGGYLRERSSPTRVGPSTAGVPHPTDHLVYICLHFAWSHAISRGGWRTFRDVALLSGRADFDWRRFVEVAAGTNGESCCYWTLRLARDLGRVAVPDEVMEALRPNLPQAAATVLARHFALQLFERWRSCPSVQVRKWLWTLAIRPRTSGHGEARPWRHGSPVLRGREEPPKRLSRRLQWHGTRINTWWQYLLRLAGSSVPFADRGQGLVE